MTHSKLDIGIYSSVVILDLKSAPNRNPTILLWEMEYAMEDFGVRNKYLVHG